jgi:hypothetical protein
MFSLVATLAFGSFAMANNVEIETVEAVSVENVEDLTENLILVVNDCDAVYYRVRNAHLAAGATQQQAVVAATLAFSQCANPEYHQK